MKPNVWLLIEGVILVVIGTLVAAVAFADDLGTIRPRYPFFDRHDGAFAPGHTLNPYVYRRPGERDLIIRPRYRFFDDDDGAFAPGNVLNPYEVGEHEW